MKKDLLSIDDLTSDEILPDSRHVRGDARDRPAADQESADAAGQDGREPVSTNRAPRTRTSFEIAEKRLSADTLNIAVASSSVLKGETLIDTALNIEAMQPDMIVLRHASSGAGHILSRICKSRIINAGDGMHEHPTQALLDAFTIREHKKRIEGLKVTIVGDLLHSRVLRFERAAADQARRRRVGERAAHARADGHRAVWRARVRQHRGSGRMPTSS